MDTANAYIPMDWRQAIAKGESLPEKMRGAALFADISGFTPLTEALARELGPKRGAEELTIHLNRVYDTLIAELHRLGGSVVSFSGDAITCWFAGDEDGRRATTCGLAMQQQMAQFAEVRTHSGRVVTLGVKTAVAIGSVRRFLVGLQEYVLIDAMAGKTLEQMVAAEHQAQRGDVVLDPSTASALADHLEIAAWRTDEESGDRFAVVTGLNLDVPDQPWPDLTNEKLSEADKQAWLLPPVYQRLHSGAGEFLAELRPAAALFLRFTGIDYDHDEEAAVKLNAFIKKAQQIFMRYEGSLLQLTIGDKGSYLYAAFGAPIAHEDDMQRAVSAALELQRLPEQFAFLNPVQIGITYGLMRAGAYGSGARRTYGVLGDAVNLSARLMAAAQPGQILAAEMVRQQTEALFHWEKIDNLQVKGKSEPVAVSRLLGLRKQQKIRLLEPVYHLPMVGRTAELTQIREKLELVLRGKGQIVGLTAEAGVGKSRLVAEVIHQAYAAGLGGYGGECQSYGTDSSYLVWQGVWRGFFDLDATQTNKQQITAVESMLHQINPALLSRLPLLGPVLNLTIPDNDLTASLYAKVRKSSLEGLLVECLLARAQLQPLLIVLEDCHWLDPLSHDLIEVIGRSITTAPVLIVMAYRPPDILRIQAPKVSQIPYFTEIPLPDFTSEEAERLIKMKLVQFVGEGSDIPEEFVAEITRRADGNPFYIEEILNYLKDMKIDPRDAEALEQIDLPNSLYSLILSRIDQLNDQQQITIRVASVIGRLFRAAMVWGVYPELGQFDRLQQDLDLLSDLELTPLDTPEPEQVYLFKHVMTQEVAYESLLFATRAILHEQIGGYIERTYRRNLERYTTLLAYHYEHSNNTAKQREYFQKAGAESQAAYANTAALNYYRKLLPLLMEHEQTETKLNLGQVYELIGEWEAAEQHYSEAVQGADRFDGAELQAQTRIALGELRRKQGRFPEAALWYAEAQSRAQQAGDQAGVAKALICSGTLAAMQGDYAVANGRYQQSLDIRRQLQDELNASNVLNNMAIVARFQGDYVRSLQLQQEALAIRRQLGNKWAIANSLNNLGNLTLDQGDLAGARSHLEEAMVLQREIGDKQAIANTLNNLGNVIREQGEFETARALYAEGLQINRDLGERWAITYLLEDMGSLEAISGVAERALQLAGAAAEIRRAINAPLSEVEQGKLARKLAFAREVLGEEMATAVYHDGQALTLNEAIDLALSN